MNRVTATQLKNKAADILNQVVFSGSEVIVERYGKPVAKITPIDRNSDRGREALKKVLDRTFGSLPDFPDVTKFRRLGRRKISALFE